MSRKEKIVIYVDGGNTYQRLKEVGLPTKKISLITLLL